MDAVQPWTRGLASLNTSKSLAILEEQVIGCSEGFPEVGSGWVLRPNEPDGSDELQEESLSSVKYSQAGGNAGGGGGTGWNVDLYEFRLEGSSGDGAQHSQKTRTWSHPVEKEALTTAAKVVEIMCAWHHRNCEDPPGP